jgi:hypothetical protein
LISGLDEAQALNRGDILLVVPFEGEHTLAHDDLERPLFLVPVAYLATIDTHREGAIGRGRLP